VLLAKGLPFEAFGSHSNGSHRLSFMQSPTFAVRVEYQLETISVRYDKRNHIPNFFILSMTLEGKSTPVAAADRRVILLPKGLPFESVRLPQQLRCAITCTV
jgi:hypothetical protein